MIDVINRQREFLMTDLDFENVSQLAYLYTGIVLGVQKKEMLYGRLARRLRELHLSSVSDYLPLIDAEEKPEVSKFINAITTNLTYFLANSICSEWCQKKKDIKKIRVWSSGCSTGEEAFSIAMTLKENLDINGWDCKILATDLDSKVINQAQQGLYSLDRIENLSIDQKKQWFQYDRNQTNQVKVKQELQELVKFKRLNLLDAWPMKGKFDLIFCRNIVIYFNELTQATLIDQYANILNDGGYLIIGHSESLNGVSQRFKPIGKTIYQKIK